MSIYIERCPEMAKFASIAYLDELEASKHFEKAGFSNHIFWDINGAQCHAVWDDEQYILAFRGTEPDEMSDVLADLNAFPSKGVSGGWVHIGFQRELEKVWDAIKEHRAEHATKKLFITGHSLGGAMATLAASRFNLIDKVECLYTYGSPRVGTRSFVKSCKFLHYRHKNNNDIVTAVPLVLMGYKHHGTLRYINFYGNIRKLTMWQAIKDKWRGYSSGLLDGAKDHSITEYFKCLAKVDRK